MTEAARYTIGQLAELAGVTPRTIRYYTAEGLLPRPDTHGQYAQYGEAHLLHLQLIAQLKETFLPLSEIKARIEHLDAAQIRALLDTHEHSPAQPASAADYLAQVRARQQTHQPPHRLAERGEPYAETPMLSLHSPAAPAPAARAPAAPAYGFATPLAAPATPPAEAAETAAAPPQQDSLLRKLMPQQRPAGQKDAARAATAAPRQASPNVEQHWRRIELAPGVELHIREPAAAQHERIDQLIALARELFEIGE